MYWDVTGKIFKDLKWVLQEVPYAQPTIIHITLFYNFKILSAYEEFPQNIIP
jgi:hypothetical protein